MAEKDKSRGEGSAPNDELEEQDDPAEDETETSDKDEADTENDENEAEDESPAALKRKLALREQELEQKKKEAAALQRKLDKAGAGTGKAKGTEQRQPQQKAQSEGDDARNEEVEGLKAQLQASQERARQRTVDMTTRDWIAGNDQRYAAAAKYIVREVELSDDDIGDDGEYDSDALSDAVDRAAKQYIKDNPRPKERNAADGGKLDANPLRGGGKASEADNLQRVDTRFGNVLTRISAGPVNRGVR